MLHAGLCPGVRPGVLPADLAAGAEAEVLSGTCLSPMPIAAAAQLSMLKQATPLPVCL